MPSPRFCTIALITLILAASPKLLPVSTCAASEPGNESHSVTHFPSALWQDVKTLPTIENAWWLIGGAAASFTVGEFEDPEGVARFLNQPVIDEVADSGNIWGDVRLQAPLVLAVWGLGGLKGNEEMADLGFDLSRSLLLTYGVVSAMKVSVGRTRPNGEDYSFPSGHTATAFSAAGVVSRRYGGWAGGVAIGLGVVAGLGRMEDRKHYASDVIAGATIGWIIGRNAGRPARTAGVSWQLVPHGRGLAVVGQF